MCSKIKKRAREQVFRDPIYGYINVEYEVITNIIDTAVFQRLRRIRQLSGVQMVFHGAEHSRFSHSLGVYNNANKFLETSDLKHILNEREKVLFLSAALLHDIGHGPYSHAFEDVFGVDHEKIGARIILENKELRNVLDSIDNEFANDISSIILKKKKFPLLEQLISSQLDVDRLDYLVRDAYYTGTSYGNIDLDRLVRVMRVKDNKVVFKESGLHAIENYLISRYHMYWQVYYHPVSRAYEIVLEKIYLRIKHLLEIGYPFKADVEPLKEIIKNPNNLEYYIMIDDFYINGLISSLTKTDDKILNLLANDFLNRKIWKYIDINKNTEREISKIESKLSEKDKIYFTARRNVFNLTYKEEKANMGDNILILLDDGSISTLTRESKIIASLTKTGSKEDRKFFYRK